MLNKNQHFKFGLLSLSYIISYFDRFCSRLHDLIRAGISDKPVSMSASHIRNNVSFSQEHSKKTKIQVYI